ncbi:hypothetical protein K438DRAFT_1788047 [Mycena galopus ATCC 62051]|nr:hypothetical protein K438DRAFT_1788047 [Mycena galopus ATCC 62051]
MHFYQQLRHIKRSLTLLHAKKQSDNEQESEREHILPQNEEKSRPIISTETRRTASNVLYFALKTLISISNNVPVAGALSRIIEPLLDITSRIEQSSVNTQGLIQLATRIERLTPIVEEMAKSDPDRGRAIVLGRELASMTTDLKAASQRGKLNQFFNSADNASALEKHNTALAQMIADATEVLKSLREFEAQNRKMQDSLSPIVMGDIIGGCGTGGRTSVDGDEQAPTFEQQASKFEVYEEGEIFRLPAMRVDEFCREYSLDETIRILLEHRGFQTARALCTVSDSSLKEAGLLVGQIAELRIALQAFRASEAEKHKTTTM